LVGHLDDLLHVFLQNLQRPQLLLLVLDDGLRRDHLLRHARRDQHVVLLGDLDPALFGVELADAHPVPGFLQVELLRFILRELHNVQPGHGGAFLPMRLEDPRRPVKEALKALDEDRTERACAEIPGDAFMPMEDAIILPNQP
jgi:hypothetical protein